MKKIITKDWNDWIKLNQDRGCDLDEMYGILLKEGFDPLDIKNSLGHEPNINLREKENNHILKPKATLFKKIKALYIEYKIIRNRLLKEIDLESSHNVISINQNYQLKTSLAEIYSIDNFLNKKECEELIAIIKTRLKPSTIATSAGDIEDDKYFRTSKTCDLGNLQNPIVAEIDRRICEFIGIEQKFSEVIQGQFYEVGEEFKAHTDFFEKDQIKSFTKKVGQRTYTFMVYLNDVEEGGETEFININHTFIPKQGRAVSWNNLTKQGTGNHNTMHQAHPVIKGSKVVITKWFRQESDGEVFKKKTNSRIKSYTREGFKKTKLDNALYQELLKFYLKNRSKDKSEHIEGNFVFIPESKKEATRIIELSRELKEKIHFSLQKPLQNWSNLILEPTFVYGIRVYQEGSLLIPHRDRENTHIISAIINIDQEVEEEWPLIIEDHFYRKHEVILKPGEVIYYESAKLLHGRPIPLNGKSFANIFCHFMPKDELQPKGPS